MTRINTNTSSLNAQKSLRRNTQDLQKALTRLSTGLRINSGKDDPAGLIAAEILHNNIVSVQKAISNTQRGNQMIATTDSALGSIGSLLHDIRALVTESANTAVMSDEQIAADQLQVDSALEAINRIAQVTKFQGRRVLDGSLDFITDADTIPQIQNLKIDQANLGAVGEMEVAVEVATAAEKAKITTSSGESTANAELYFSARNISDGGADDLYIIANSNSEEFDGVQVVFDDNNGGGGVTADYDAGSKILTVTYQNGAGNDTYSDIVTAIEGTNLFTAYGTNEAANSGTLNDVNLDRASLNIYANEKGIDFNDVKIKLETSGATGENAPTASYDPNAKEITIQIDSNAADPLNAGYTDVENIMDVINSSLTDFNATVSANGGFFVFGTLEADTRTKADTAATGYLKSSFSDATRAQATIDFAAAVKKSFSLDGAATADVYFKATELGAKFDQVDIEFVADGTAGAEEAEWDASAKSLIIHYEATSSTLNDVINAVDATGAWDAVLDAGDTANGANKVQASEASVRTGIDTLTIEAIEPGANFNNMQVVFQAQEDQTTPVAKYDRDANQFTIMVDYDKENQIEMYKIAQAIDKVDGFASYFVDDGIGAIFGGGVDATAVGNTGSTGGNTLLDDLVLEVAGNDGMEVFTFNKGTTSNQVASAISLVADAIGVEAEFNRDLITIQSTLYGSKAFVDIAVIDEGGSGMLERSVSAFRDEGEDADAKINGVQATADGNKVWINTSMLDMTIDLTAESTDDFKFNITGGGAQFQLGPDVVTNQQLRVGIQSLNTARLGGVNGAMYQLQTGGNADLFNDPNQAAKIVGDAIDVVTDLRGRLGALQGLTMDTNIKTMEDTMENMVQAESQIRDADFAVETANLTRAQVLVQSGTTVLQIANQNPRNVLALLQG